MLVKEGQIYKLEEHMLACGDCRNPELVKKLIGSQKIKMILTDPPYGVGYVENKKGFCQIKKDVVIVNMIELAPFLGFFVR